jgi:hypothetical protein
MIPRNRNCHDYTNSMYKVTIKWENGSPTSSIDFLA